MAVEEQATWAHACEAVIAVCEVGIILQPTSCVFSMSANQSISSLPEQADICMMVKQLPSALTLNTQQLGRCAFMTKQNTMTKL